MQRVSELNCDESRKRKMKQTVKINGMSCNHCVMAVTKALNEIPGLSEVQVDLASGEATFEAKENVDMKEVAKQIEKAGYEPG
jgi:copper chaperone